MLDQHRVSAAFQKHRQHGGGIGIVIHDQNLQVPAPGSRNGAILRGT